MNDPVWSTPEWWPSLNANEVHVWLAHLPGLHSHLSDFISVLAADERERAARYRFDAHRERAQISRGLLRVLLGRYTEQPAGALTFAYNEHGKPHLPGSSGHFNTSHSGDYAVFAFTRAGAVGVDIEQVREEMVRRDQIAAKYFAPGERQQLSALPEAERGRGFFDFWTRKEAFVKARGDGLFSGLDQFETCLAEPRVLTVRGAPATDWWLSELPEVSGYSGAVVVNAMTCTAHFWNWNQALLKASR